MINIYKKIVLFFVLLLACAGVWAQSGSSCSAAIPLGRNYSATITGAGSKWYVANTFDLPLTVKFYPQNNSDPAPDLEFDFTCTPGVYEDSILCSLFCASNSGHITMPAVVYPTKKTDEEGKKYYEVAMGEDKRDLLLWAGISYDVNVYVKVTYYGRGTLSVTPDAEFSQCMDTEKWLLLGRTLPVAANDTETFFVAPYANWRGDSIRYIWSGPAAATVAVGTTCSFDPFDPFDERCIDPMSMKAGGDTMNHTSAMIQDYLNYMNDVNNTAKGGMFYVKAISTQPGTLKVERMPEPRPEGGATLLEYDKATAVTGDTTTLYAIHRSWTSATRFDTPTDYVFKMYVGTDADFLLKDAIGTYQFNATEDNGHWLGLTQTEMEALMAQTGQKYLYVRFESKKATTITPSLWEPSDCITKANLVQKDTTLNIAARSKAIHRFYYNEWKGGDMTVTWNKSKLCKMLVSGGCTIGTDETADAVIYYQGLDNTPYTVSATEIADWAGDIDGDGYFYIRFYPTGTSAGEVTISTTAPEEEDPACAPYDSVLTVEAWDQYEWRGTTYVNSGEYTAEGAIDPETNCADTIYTLHLTIHTTTTDTYAEAGCDSVIYNGEVYKQSGEYLDTIYDAMGNRSIVTLQLTVNHPTTSDTTAYVCGPFEWHGMLCEQAGEYTDTLVNAAQCDSIVTLHLAILEPTTVTLPDTTVCAELGWDGYLLVDTIIMTPGTYTRITQTVGGCDSIVTQTVDVKEETYYTDYVTAYDSCVWIDGKTYRKSGGGPVYHMPNAAGCDSVISLYLTIKHLHKDTVRHSVCPSELPYVWYGKSCEGAGLHNADTMIAAEVDTLRTLDLTVLQTSASDTTATACDAFTWYGKTYTESGNPTRTLSNAAGCDSVITLNLTIRYSTSSEEYRSEYMSYTWNGETYRYDGTYFYQTTNAAGCDSVAILHLTLQHDTVVEWFCPKSGIVEHVDTLSNPRINYVAYRYEKPSMDLYMDGVVSGETAAGAYVDLARVQTNLAAYYIEPLTPVESISWRYAPFGGQNETLEVGAGAQWINAGTISMDMIFHCGYRYYGSFTVGKMTEKSDIVPVAEQPMKRIENGQVVIIRNGKKYNMVGLEIGK